MAIAERLISPAVSDEEGNLIDFIRNGLSSGRSDHAQNLREGVGVVVRSMEQGNLSKDGADRLVGALLAMYLENTVADQIWDYFNTSPVVSQGRDSRIDHR